MTAYEMLMRTEWGQLILLRLGSIERAEGRFSADREEHASNCIEDMQEDATKILAALKDAKVDEYKCDVALVPLEESK